MWKCPCPLQTMAGWMEEKQIKLHAHTTILKLVLWLLCISFDHFPFPFLIILSVWGLFNVSLVSLWLVQTGIVHGGPRTGRLYSGWLKPPTTSLVPIYRASVTSEKWSLCTEPKGCKKTTPALARVCSPCCHLTKDTEVSAAMPPDCGGASFPGLWESSIHHQHSIV